MRKKPALGKGTEKSCYIPLESCGTHFKDIGRREEIANPNPRWAFNHLFELVIQVFAFIFVRRTHLVTLFFICGIQLQLTLPLRTLWTTLSDQLKQLVLLYIQDKGWEIRIQELHQIENHGDSTSGPKDSRETFLYLVENLTLSFLQSKEMQKGMQKADCSQSMNGFP